MRRYQVVLIHAAGWTSFLLYEWMFKQGALQNPEQALFHFKIVLIRVASLLPAVYFTIGFLVPKLFLASRKVWFVVALVATIAADTWLMKTLNYYLVLKDTPGFATSYLDALCNITGWLVFMGNIAFNVSFVMMLFFVNKWIKDDRKRQALETAKKEAEFQLLKSQVHPHFLFNTLNNIYALSKTGSQQTTEMIYRLSGILEYMLYDSGKTWVPLELELAYIGNYLNLGKIRYGNRLDISFQTYGELNDLIIPPLILLPFVENSFKHGLSQQTGPCWLRIEVDYSGDVLTLKVENSKAEERKNLNTKGGLGIMNVRKRLDILLNEPFELKQIEDAESYLVVMRMKPRKEFDEIGKESLEMSGH